jgi:YmgG-like glycine-zipper protein
MFRNHSKRVRLLLPVSAMLIAVGACGRGNQSAADDALKNDLSLASQAQAYQPQQFMSPTEQGYGANPYGGPNAYANPNAPYGYPQRSQTATRAASYPRTARRSSSGVYRSSGSSGTYSRQPAEPVRNTKRDAVIGAAAGAVLGASTSRDKMKGAIIGAAAGGILGGIIGHTVDVKNP